MAKEINLADIEPQIELIKQINIGTVQKVIARAEREGMAASKRQQRVVKRVLHPGKLARTLDKAMSFHGRSARGQPSIRLKAPDTGGRPFHFGFTVVTKGVRAKKGSGKAGGATGGSSGAQGQAGAATQPGPQPGSGSNQNARTKKGRNRRHRASTGEGAHQLYTERDAAVDIAQPLDRAFVDTIGPDLQIPAGIGLDPAARTNAATPEEEQEKSGLPKKQKSNETERPTAQQWVEEGMSLTPGLSSRSNESAAQAYIEDPSKLPRLRGHTASFGTIGDTIEERLRFWELVHEHESDKGGHTQSRLVLELPHEASAAERHEIVRTFTDRAFRAKGLPYWVSIHAPTKENDWRNHHAHVVFSERPAAKMINPETGREEWDFAITGKRVKKSRNVIITHPFRQSRDLDFRDRGWVKRARAEFSDTVNEVMERAGKGRLYDPRSYKGMGLDASPMKNVSRIIADKTKTKTFVVMDAEWTRKMIDEEIRDAAIRRDATFQALVKTEAMIVEAAKSATHTAKIQAKLPKHLRMGPTMLFGTQLTNTITTKVLETERERLAQQFLNEATERTLKHIIEATSPRPKARTKGKVYDTENAPDPEDLVDLHTAATKELAAHRLATATTRQKISARMRELRKQWNRHDNPPPESPPTGPQPAKTRADQPGPETFATEHAPTRSAATTASPQQTQAPSRSASISLAQTATGETPSRGQTEQTPAAPTAGASPVARREARQPTATPAAGRPRGYRGLPPLSEAAARLSAAMGAAIDMVGDIAPENVKSAMQQALDAMGAKEAAMRAALREMEKEQGPLLPRPQQGARSTPQSTTQSPAPAPAPPPPIAGQTRPAPTKTQDAPLVRPTGRPPEQARPSQSTATPGLPFIPPRDPRPLEMRIITHPAAPAAPAVQAAPPATPTAAPTQTPTPPTPSKPTQPGAADRPAAQPRPKQESQPAPRPKAAEPARQEGRQPSLFDGTGLAPPLPPTPAEKPKQPEETKQSPIAPASPEKPELTPEEIAEKRRKARRRVFVKGRGKGRSGFER